MKKVTIAELGTLTGFDRRTISKRLENLEPEKSGKAKYYKSTDALRSIYSDETVDRDRLQQKKLKLEVEKRQIELDQQKGELVEIDKVAKDVGDVFSVVRQRLLSIPSKAAQDLSHVDDPAVIQHLLDESMNEALAELQNYEETQNRNRKKTKGKSKTRAKTKSR